MVLVSAMHITAAVYVNDWENGLIHDFQVWLEKLAPAGLDYRHHQTGEDNADAHLKRTIMGHQVMLPITAGKLDLGPWEQVFYAEFDGQRQEARRREGDGRVRRVNDRRSIPIVRSSASAPSIVQDGKVLLVKRRYEPLAGQWSLPGGAVEVGETLEACVAREMLEETGLEVEVGPVIEVFDRITRDDEGRVRYHFVLVDYCAGRLGGALHGRLRRRRGRVCRSGELPRTDLTAKATSVIGGRSQLDRQAAESAQMTLSRDEAWALLDRVDAEREPAETCAGGRGRGARLRAHVRRERRGLGHRRTAARFRLRALSDGGRSSVSRVRELRRRGYPEWVMRAILSHADYRACRARRRLEKTLFACDEMAGFVTAAALVRPSKSVLDLEAPSVIKRMKDKAFARAVSREDLRRAPRSSACRSRSTSPT